ncbi:MAG: hypothetical protein JST39_16550 [Bacteroidetes bacterium]|nr:hypothetical protein [Bacteroidota bacterium]
MNREKWIEDILQTSRQVRPVEVNPFMATRVEAALREDGEAASPARLPLRWLWISVVCMAGLIALNVLSWNRPLKPAQVGIQSVMQEYGWSGNRFYSAE